VLRIDLSTGRHGGGLDAPTSSARLLRRQHRTQPAVGYPAHALQRLWSAAAQPNLQWRLHWAHRHCRFRRGPCTRSLLACPRRSHELERLLEKGAASDAIGPSRVSLVVQPQQLTFARLLEPGDKAEEQPPVGDAIELRKGLGEQERITSQRDDVGAEPQTAGSSGEHRQA
jgi:hypothetical protein